MEKESRREAIKRKIVNLSINGDRRFVLSNNEHKFEFKIISVSGDQYKVFGGFGYALRVFNKHDDAEKIVVEFERALKGMDLSIESCYFLSPNYFAS